MNDHNITPEHVKGKVLPFKRKPVIVDPDYWVELHAKNEKLTYDNENLKRDRIQSNRGYRGKIRRFIRRYTMRLYVKEGDREIAIEGRKIRDVLYAISERLNDKNRSSKITVDELAEKTFMSKTTVRRILKAAKRAQLIRVVYHKRAPEYSLANEYFFNEEELES